MLIHQPGLFARKSIARLSAAAPFMPKRATLRLGGVRFECEFALDPRVRDMYFGAYEPDEVALLRRVLRPGDTFVDVGANIGYFTAVGASLVGPAGQVHAFEPVPEFFARLETLARLNPSFRIHVNGVAIGDREGVAEIRVSAEHNIGWNTMVPGLMSADRARAAHEVRVLRLDRYLEERGIETVSLIKVDVEGFELPALRGLAGWLERTRQRPPILCEVAPGAYPRLGCEVADLFRELGRFGYRATGVTPGAGPVRPETLRETTNVLFGAG